MAVKFHRCSNLWVKIDSHPCWRVQKALDETGVAYELVKERSFPRGKRTETIRRTGQSKLPWFELEDGTILREESKELAARIRAGKLGESPGASGSTAGGASASP